MNEGFEVFQNTFTTLYKAHCFKEKTAKHAKKIHQFIRGLLRVYSDVLLRRTSFVLNTVTDQV